MENNQISTGVSLSKQHCKDKHYQIQSKIIFAAFKTPATMLSVSIKTGILRANICRNVAHLRKTDSIHLVRFDICPISKHRAGFYTTSESLYPASINPSKSACND
ncbi:MAG: hypothetical protein GZ094_19630 [Mariniphaga sp.]|nr:hypothetical protein [Mariniphaga sp.]